MSNDYGPAAGGRVCDRVLTGMRVAIVGSRGWRDREAIESRISRLYALYDNQLMIISGGAQGVDTVAEEFADTLGVPVNLHLPMWQMHGKRAGFIRNQQIVDDADMVIAFWDGESHGTKDSIDRTLKAKKTLEVYFP